MKISDKKIIIFDEAKYEAEKAKITIVKPGTVYKKESGMKYLFVGTGYSLRTKIRDIYAACRVSYQQGSSKSNIEATYTAAGKKGKTLQVNEQVESVAEAFFVEALQRKTYTEYLLDSFLDGSPEERRELVAQQGKEVMKLEQRIAEWTAAGTLHRGTGQKQPGTDRER